MLNWMERRRFPHLLGVMISLAVNVAVFTALILIGTRLFDGFRGQIEVYAFGLKDNIEAFAIWLEAHHIKGAKEYLKFDAEGFAEFAQGKEFVGGLAVVGTKVFGTVASVLSTMFFVFIIMIFILVESRGIDVRLEAIRKSRGPDLRGLLNVAGDIQKYLAIKTLVSGITGVLAVLVCWLAGIESPILWGLVAFFLNFIPAIGSVVAGIPPLLIAAIEHGFWAAGGVFAGYLAINIALGNFLEPTLLGKRFGVSTLVVIVSVLFWGWLWGPVGMFLAVPLTMMLKVVFDTVPDLRWISVAMGKNSPELKDVAETGMVLPESPSGGGADAPGDSPQGEGAN